MDSFAPLSSLMTESFDLADPTTLSRAAHAATNDEIPLIDFDSPGYGYGSYCTIAWATTLNVM